MNPVLAVRGLHVRRTVPILRGIDWTVRRGEHWVILGPNGCGKTSLLAALTAFLTPTSGEVAVLGSTFGTTDWRELRKHIGFVSSSLSGQIEFDERAIDVVASGPSAVLNIWHTPTNKEYAGARRLLSGWKCSDLADRPWGVLSQGERQRVLIARALLGKPPLVLLDEPCAGLDPVAREVLLDLIEQQARRRGGPAIVLITHHVEEITPAFTHTLLLRAGQAIAQGPIASTLTAKNLTATFSVPVRLNRRNGRWRMALKP